MTDDTNVADGPGPNVVTLSLEDVKKLLVIIDIASKRGAFVTKEFSEIGPIYERVEKFLNARAAEVAAASATKGE